MYLERALFICAPKNSGKSTQLRSMLRDYRFESRGKVPKPPKKPPPYYFLSNERVLHLRLTSPHETGNSPKKFHDKIEEKYKSVKSRNKSVKRLCFAGAMQPTKYKKMPDIVKATELFCKKFTPERVRVIFLNPDKNGKIISDYCPGIDLEFELRKIKNVEVVHVNAEFTNTIKQRNKNGLFYSDFFDFT